MVAWLVECERLNTREEMRMGGLGFWSSLDLLLKSKQNEVNLAGSRARSVWVGRWSPERQARWMLGERGIMKRVEYGRRSEEQSNYGPLLICLKTRPKNHFESRGGLVKVRLFPERQARPKLGQREENPAIIQYIITSQNKS